MSQLNAITDGSDSIQDSELTILKNDLQQLIQLSEESLLELKKQQLFKKLNDISGESAEPSSSKKLQEIKLDPSSEDLVGKKKKQIKKIILIQFFKLNFIASKCRVYFPCSNTNLKMHNALVIGIDSNEENTVSLKKTILFCINLLKYDII